MMTHNQEAMIINLLFFAAGIWLGVWFGRDKGNAAVSSQTICFYAIIGALIGAAILWWLP